MRRESKLLTGMVSGTGLETGISTGDAWMSDTAFILANTLALILATARSILSAFCSFRFGNKIFCYNILT